MYEFSEFCEISIHSTHLSFLLLHFLLLHLFQIQTVTKHKVIIRQKHIITNKIVNTEDIEYNTQYRIKNQQ